MNHGEGYMKRQVIWHCKKNIYIHQTLCSLFLLGQEQTVISLNFSK